MTVRLVSSVEIVRIAKTAGFDALYIDLEHSAFSIQTASQISVMALEAGIPALVRVPARTPEYISRVLDGGALGVIAPGVRSAAQAQSVVAGAKYPPLGSRGVSTGLAHLGLRSVPAAEALPASPRRRSPPSRPSSPISAVPWAASAPGPISCSSM
jgi:4-hydroxy-2-oxoheptanedioate aldolase